MMSMQSLPRFTGYHAVHFYFTGADRILGQRISYSSGRDFDYCLKIAEYQFPIYFCFDL